MTTKRLQELLGRIIIGITPTLEERAELLQFVINMAVTKDEVAFTLHGLNVTKTLYDDVCLILKDGKYFGEYTGRFHNNNKLKAIKLIRERLACGLKEAKDISEDRHFPDYGQYKAI